MMNNRKSINKILNYVRRSGYYNPVKQNGLICISCPICQEKHKLFLNNNLQYNKFSNEVICKNDNTHVGIMLQREKALEINDKIFANWVGKNKINDTVSEFKITTANDIKKFVNNTNPFEYIENIKTQQKLKNFVTEQNNLLLQNRELLELCLNKNKFSSNTIKQLKIYHQNDFVLPVLKYDLSTRFEDTMIINLLSLSVEMFSNNYQLCLPHELIMINSYANQPNAIIVDEIYNAVYFYQFVIENKISSNYHVISSTGDFSVLAKNIEKLNFEKYKNVYMLTSNFNKYNEDKKSYINQLKQQVIKKFDNIKVIQTNNFNNFKEYYFNYINNCKEVI